MNMLKNRTPIQKASYVVVALIVVLAIVWFVSFTPLWRLFGAD